MARGYLVALFAIVLMVEAEGADQIKYNCTSGGQLASIDFSSLNGPQNYEAAWMPNSTDGSNITACCVQMKPISNSSIYAVNENCSNTGDWILYLKTSAREEEKLLGFNATITKYDIACKTINVSTSATLDILLRSTAIPVLQTIDLKMTIKPENISLGQMVNVSISDQTDGHHMLYLLSCNANTIDESAGLVLIQNGNITESSVVNDIETPGAGSVWFTFYGFRFLSSPTIKLTCAVKVCRTSKDCGMSTTSANGGRRRSKINTPEDSVYSLDVLVRLRD